MLLKNLSYHEKKNSNFNRFAIFEAPKSILLSLFFILTSSVLCLYSSNGGNMIPWAIKQVYFIIFSLCIFYVLISINVKYLFNYAYIFLFIVCILLIIVIPFGKRALGASRWIDFGFITLQPSEFAKIAVVLALSKFFSKINSTKIYKFSTLFYAFLIISPIIALVVIQPDLATSMIILFLSVVLIFCAGTPKKYFIAGFITLLFSLPFIWLKFLKEYQKLRIINFIFPENDPLGSGYNVIQSKIAIGSGGPYGKGFLQGTQGRLKFLPEHHTDFIFTIVGEEFGFIGSLIIIFFYLYIIFYGLTLTKKVNSVFGKMVCIGCSTILFLHLFINIGMTIALMPVAGIPLIMFSYGGCGVLLGLMCVALIINIDINKNIL